MTADSKPTPSERRSLLNSIRKRPPMYLGTLSLTRFGAFVQGYRHALFCHSIKSDHSLDIPREIHDWVAYRLHFYESTRSYVQMILERTGDEASALQRFFQLLDEYDKRLPKVVAFSTTENWLAMHDLASIVGPPPTAITMQPESTVQAAQQYPEAWPFGPPFAVQEKQ